MSPRHPRFRPLILAAAAVVGAAGVALSLEASATASTAAVQPSGSGSASESQVFAGFTEPSEEVSLGFDTLGRVSMVDVKPGDTVEKGQLLMQLDTEVEKAQLAAATAEANNEERLKLARLRRDLAKSKLDRAEDGFQSGGINQNELEDRQVEYNIAETQIVEEEKQGTIAAARVQQANSVIAQKSLHAPAAGIVRAVDFSEGEIYTPQGQLPAVAVVTIDPLYVRVNIAPDVAAAMNVGDTVEVRYDGTDDWLEASLIFVDPVINDSVMKQLIRLEMPNPELVPAGRQVEVRVRPN